MGGFLWPGWPFWRSSLDVAIVAIGFTNLEQLGDCGSLLATAVFGTSCLDGSMYFDTVAFEMNFTTGIFTL